MAKPQGHGHHPWRRAFAPAGLGLHLPMERSNPDRLAVADAELPGRARGEVRPRLPRLREVAAGDLLQERQMRAGPREEGQGRVEIQLQGSALRLVTTGLRRSRLEEVRNGVREQLQLT